MCAISTSFSFYFHSGWCCYSLLLLPVLSVVVGSVHPSIHPWAHTLVATFYLFHSENRFVVCVCVAPFRITLRGVRGRSACSPLYTFRLHPHSHWTLAPVCCAAVRTSVYFTIWLFILYLPVARSLTHTHTRTTFAHACSIRVEKTHKFLSIFYHSI